MNLYILAYERWESSPGQDTSDGFPTWNSDYGKHEKKFEAESDEKASERAVEILSEETKKWRKIQFPALTRAVALPKLNGIRTCNPEWEYHHYYVEEVVST